MTAKEYKTLYYEDSETGRTAMQCELNRLLAQRWRINPLQANDEAKGIMGALLVSEAADRKPKLMLILERERHPA